MVINQENNGNLWYYCIAPCFFTDFLFNFFDFFLKIRKKYDKTRCNFLEKKEQKIGLKWNKM